LRDGGINGKTSRIRYTWQAIQTAWSIVRRWPDSTEIATKLLQLPTQTRNPSSAFIFNPGALTSLTNRCADLAARRAFDTLGTNIGRTAPALRIPGVDGRGPARHGAGGLLGCCTTEA
jgi:hypothetical protein